MANAEMYDYLSTIAADVAITLGAGSYAIHPQGTITETGDKNQIIHTADDDSEERVSLSDNSIFYVTFAWNTITGAESGSLMDLWHDPAKANGRQKSFMWAHPDDGHTYVVRFDCSLPRARRAYDIYGILKISIRVLGRIADV